jgi:hypothetical protein
MGFILFGRRGIRYDDEVSKDTIFCSKESGIRCTEFSDPFLSFQPGLLVYKNSQTDEVLSVLGTAQNPKFFTGKVHYSTPEIVGENYRCRFQEIGTQNYQDTPVTRAFSSSYLFPALAPQLLCAVPKWEYSETTFYFKVIRGDADDEILFSPVMSGKYQNFPHKRLSIWWSLSGPTSGNSRGGDTLLIIGFGFDSTKLYKALFRDASHEERSNLTIINLTHALVQTPWWRDSADVTQIDIERSDGSIVGWSSRDPNSNITYNYTVGTPDGHVCTGEQCAVGCNSSLCLGAALGPACLGYSCTLATWDPAPFN